MTEFCSNCGDLCCGKLRVKAFKDKYYPFCTCCFDLFRCLRIEVVREILKNNENFVTE